MTHAPKIQHRIRSHPSRSGFSLIEVLFAVFVLALGLLGLAAVFPAVIAQQRGASDTTLGLVAESAVASILEVGDEIADWNALFADYGFSASNRPQDCESGSIYGGFDPENIEFLWEADWRWAGVPASNFENFRRTGEITVGGFEYRCNNGNVLTISGSYEPVTIPLSARLYPAPYSGNDPRFVWDFVARRTPANQIQIAVFIRPIDPAIRVPSGFSLSDVLTGNRVNSSQFRLPVAVDPAGIPTGNGSPTDRYSVPIAVNVRAVDGRPDHLNILASPFQAGVDPAVIRAQLGRVGQRFVDNLGVVRRVVAISKDNADPATDSYEVIVDPPFLPSQTLGPGQPVTTLSERAQKVRQVVFTPQTPVAVFTRIVR